MAVECADDQSKRETMAGLLTQDTSLVIADAWAALALRANIANTVSFEDCVGTGAHRDRLARIAREADSLGIRGVPTVLVGNHVIVGAVPLSTLRRVVRLTKHESAHGTP